MRGMVEIKPLLAAASLFVVFSLFFSSATALEAHAESERTRISLLSATTIEGKTIEIDFSTDSPPAILTFWSIYCKSCVEELEKVQALVEKYGFDRIRVYAVNEDFNLKVERVSSFVETLKKKIGKIGFTVLYDRDSKIFRSLSLKHLPSLVYVGGNGNIREVIEGFERGRQRAVISALSKLIEEVAPEKLREVSEEAYYEVETRVPVCGIYVEQKWVRPVDDSRGSRQESVQNALKIADYLSRREALKRALEDIGVRLYSRDIDLSCVKPYGIEREIYLGQVDGLDLFIDTFSLRDILTLEEDSKSEGLRYVKTFREYKANLAALQSSLLSKGFTPKHVSYVLKFVNTDHFTHNEFLEKLKSQVPMIGGVKSMRGQGQVMEDELSCYIPEREMLLRLLEGVDLSRKKVTATSLGGNLVEIEFWR